VVCGVLLALAACAPGGAAPAAKPAAESRPAWQQQWDDVSAKARQEGKVVIEVPAEVVDGYRVAFRSLRERFGFDIEARPSTPDTPQVLLRECAVGRQSIDLLLSGMGEAIEVYPKGCLAPVKPRLILPEVTDPANWRGGVLKFNDPEDAYFFQVGESIYGPVIINSERLKPEDIASSRDLLKPEYKGKIAGFDPRRAGAGRSDATYFLRVLGPDFVRALYLDQGMTTTADHRQLAEWVARGVHWIGVGHVERGVEPLRREGLPIQVAALQDAPGYAVGGTTVLKLVKDSPHPNAATVLLNWMASREGQKLMMDVIGQPTRRTDVEIPDSVPWYRIPKDGVSYLDEYDFDTYVNKRPEAARVLTELLGR
jgi:ABC-type Fe3+ transport system substrate-binding protein